MGGAGSASIPHRALVVPYQPLLYPEMDEVRESTRFRWFATKSCPSPTIFAICSLSFFHFLITNLRLSQLICPDRRHTTKNNKVGERRWRRERPKKGKNYHWAEYHSTPLPFTQLPRSYQHLRTILFLSAALSSSWRMDCLRLFFLVSGNARYWSIFVTYMESMN